MYLPALAPDARRSSPPPCHPTSEGSRLSSTTLSSIAPAPEELAWIGPDEFVGADHDGLGTFSLSGLFGLFGLSCVFG